MIKNIVFTSGGTKGICYIGVIKLLEEYNLLKNLNTYCGVSIGSIFALLLLLDYTYKELEELLINNNLMDLINITNENIINLLDNYGLDDSKLLIKTIKECVFKKTNINNDITFIDLYNLFNKKLIIIGTCLNTHYYEQFDYINTPYMSIFTAINISICIPILFKPIKYNNKLYVDGAITNRMPINIFLNELEDTIIFNITFNKTSNNINNFIDYLYNIIMCKLTHNYDSYRKYYLNLFINCSILEFNMDLNEKKKIINYSYNETKKYIETRYKISNI